jgi:hypothetical protein
MPPWQRLAVVDSQRAVDTGALLKLTVVDSLGS